MDQGWKQIPLFVILLLLSNAYGFKVLSSVSEVPVTGILPKEMGLLKRLNLLQFVKGSVSSRHESTAESGSSSHQGADRQPANFQHPWKQFASTGSSGTQSGSSTPFNLQGSTAYGGSQQLQGTTSQFGSGTQSSYPSLGLSSRQGAESQSVKAQSSHKFTFTGSSGTQSGSSTPFNLQGSTAYGGSRQLQGTTSQFPSGTQSSYLSGTPSSYLSSPQGADSQSAKVQYPWKQFTSTGSSGTQPGSSTPSNLQGSTASGGSRPLQGTTSQFASGSPSSYSSLALSSPREAVRKSVAVQNSQKQLTSIFTGSSGTQSGSSTPFNLQGSTASGGSRQLQGTISQFASGSPSYPIAGFEVRLGADSQSAKVQYPLKQFTSTGSFGTQPGSSTPSNLQGSTASGGSRQLQGTTSQFASGLSTKVQYPLKQFTSTGSSGTQSGSSTPFNLQGRTASGGSWQLQGTTSQFASGSPSSYPSLALSSPQGAASQSAKIQYPWKQFPSTGSSGTQSGSSTPFNLQGSNASGSRQLKGTASQFASASPSYPRVGPSPQGADSQSAKFTYPWKQFTSTGSSGPQSGSSTPVNLQGSTASGGSRQLQGTASQFASGLPSSYPSLALSSPQGADSQSAKIQYPWKQFPSTGSSGTQSGSSTPFNLQGSNASGGSWQLQGTTSQLATGSPSYPSVALSSPQKAVRKSEAVRKSVAVQSSQKQYTSSSGTPSGSSTPFNLQGSTASASQQLQGTTSQFASGSPSSYPSLALSSPQEAVRKSVAVQSSQKQYTSSSGTPSGSSTPFTLQSSTASGGSRQLKGTTSQFASGSPSSYPSLALSSPQGADSQSAKVTYPWKQFTSTGSSGPQSGFSTPVNLQGSTTSGGSRQFQGTTSQLATGSPSYPSVALSSPQKAVRKSEAVRKSVAVQGSQKQYTSSSGTPSGSSTPFNLQGSTASGSWQLKGTTSQFASGSPSSYPSLTLSSPQGADSQSAKVQYPWKQFTSTGSSGTQSGSSTPFNLQGSTAYGGSRQLQGTTSQLATGSPSYPSVALSSPQKAVRKSVAVQSSQKQYTSSSGTPSGSSTSFNLQGSTAYGGSRQLQGTTSQLATGSPSYPSVALSSPQKAVRKSVAVQSSQKQYTSSSGTPSGSSTPFNLQGSTAYGGSRQLQGTTSQLATGSPSYPSVALSSPQKAVRKSVAVQSSQKQYTSSSGTPSGSSTPFNLQGSTASGGSRQLKGTTSQFVSGSPSSYPSLALSSPQGADSQSAKVQYPWKQFTSTGSSGTQSGSSTPFNLQGSTAYGGSRQLQGTTSQLATGSPSYPSVALSSPQKAVRKSVAVQASQKQLTSTFTGSSGAQSGSSTPFNLQGSTTSGGIRQLQGTKSQLASGSPFPIAGFEVRIGADSQSAKVQTLQKFTSTFTGSSGTHSGSSTPFNLQGSTASGSQLKGTTSQFASGSPSSYPSLALSSPQGADSQSAKVQYPWKQFASTGSSGTQSGSSTPFNLQGSTASGSRQLKGTTSQFASGSPSSYPSLALSSPQGKKSPRLQPSQDLQASRAAASQFGYYYSAKGL